MDKPVSNDEFKHKTVENVRTEAYCSVDPQTTVEKSPRDSSGSILRAALDPNTIKLAMKPVTERDQRALLDSPKPADFGNHEPIPVEAVSIVSVAEGDDKK
jgi:hypothetical protein